MKNAYLQAKIEERTARSSMLQTIQDVAVKEKRDLTDAERKTFDEIVARLKELDLDIERIAQFDQGAAKFMSMIGAHDSAVESAEHAHDTEREDESSEVRSTQSYDFGRAYVESTEFKQYRSGTGQAVRMPGPASEEFRAAITTGFYGGTALDRPMLWAGPTGPTYRQPLLDMIGRVATNANAVAYQRYQPVPVGEAEEVAEGALKPEADLSIIEKSAMLVTWAHWKAITRQALEDHSQLQSIIQTRLLAGVRRKIGSVTVAKLLADTDIPEVEAASLLIGIRTAIADAEARGYTPNSILVNPADSAALDLAAMGASFSGPVRSNTAWGLPVATDPAVPAGSGYVGDFRDGITWFDRGTTDVYLTDSHADYFLRNQLVILAEARGQVEVTEPGALVKVTATADGGGSGGA